MPLSNKSKFQDDELVFKLVNSWAVVVSFAYLIFCIAFGYHKVVIINISILFLSFSIFFLIHQKTGKYEALKLPFAIITTLIISCNWFFLGGYHGEAPVYFMLSLLVFLMILHEKKQLIILTGSILMLISLSLVQFYYPELVLQFSDKHYSISVSTNCMICMIGVFGLMSRMKFRMQENNIQLAQKNIELENATEAKSKFLANMSHEIRTPMNGLIGMASILNNTALNKEQKEYVNTIQVSSERLLNIVNEILDFSKIEAGETVLRPGPFNLKDCIQEVMEISLPKAKDKNLELNLDIQFKDDKKPKFINADSGKLRQILLNLIDNGIKFTQMGKVVLSIDCKTISEDQIMLMFSIRDTGIGISEEDKSKLFQKFSQIDGSYTKKYTGTGLGLVIVKELIELMGGQFNIKSKLNEGTSFYFEFTAELIEESEYLHYSTQKPIENKNDYELNLKGLEILVVEDDRINHKLVQKLLDKLGITPDLAFNGIQAVEYSNQKNYDIILMDLQMPEMDGIEASKLIRSRITENPPVIIALTANVFEDVREECLEAGMNDYLAKPITIASFTDMIRKWI